MSILIILVTYFCGPFMSLRFLCNILLLQRLQQELKDKPGSHPFDEVLTPFFFLFFFLNLVFPSSPTKAYLEMPAFLYFRTQY